MSEICFESTSEPTILNILITIGYGLYMMGIRFTTLVCLFYIPYRLLLVVIIPRDNNIPADIRI